MTIDERVEAALTAEERAVVDDAWAAVAEELDAGRDQHAVDLASKLVEATKGLAYYYGVAKMELGSNPAGKVLSRLINECPKLVDDVYKKRLAAE